MKTRIFLFMLVCSLPAMGQTEKQVDSKITEVTVFLNKAQVTREVKARLDAGKTSLNLPGLTSQLDPQSIQVVGKGNLVILGIAHQQNYLNEMNMPKSLRVLKDSLELLQRQVTTEQSQKEILNKEEQMLLSNQKIGGANQNLTVNELKSMADFYRSRLGDIVIARNKYDEKIKKLNERIVKINLQINEQNELYRTNTSEIVINVMAEQRTGEEWKNVKLKLSTANPAEGGVKPELYPWYLDFYNPIVYPKNADGRKQKSYAPAMRAEAAVVADEEMAEVQSLSQYVVTTQTSLNTEFEIALPYTVASAAKPTLVDIRNYEVKATYNYSAAPKLDRDAFLLAKATGWEEYSLLPGEANIFFEGTYVGKSYIDPNSTKDTLTFSLGRDKRIVVNREKVKDLTSRSTRRSDTSCAEFTN